MLLHAAGWLVYMMADYLDHVLFGNYDPMPTIICGVVAYLFTGGIALIDGSLLDKGKVRRFGVMALLLTVVILLWHKVFLVFHTDTTIAESFQTVLAFGFMDWIGVGYMAALLFICWAGFYLLARSFVKRQEQERGLAEARLETKKAQLQSLQNQLNPHFLFNILNSVDVSARVGDNETVHRMTSHLSRFLRSSLEHSDNDKVTLERELVMIKDFVAIEEIRFKDSLSVEFDVELGIEKCLLPPMLLQPLMENAVKYAWSQAGKGEIRFCANREGDNICISIVNSRGDTTRAGTGTGLKNTRDRLKLEYDDDASIRVKETRHFFYLDLLIPYERELAK